MNATGEAGRKRPSHSQLRHPFSWGELRARWQEVRALVPRWLAATFPRVVGQREGRELATTFLKLGATSFGGGIAVIAQIRRLVVRERRWLSEEEFLDAVSVAQSLPGANAANAITYVGLKLGGLRGAAISLTSFLLPSFLMMIALTIAHSHLEQSPDAKFIFQGFNAAVVGMITATTARLGQTAMQRQWHLELGVAAAFLLIFTDTTIAEVVLVAGLIGLIIQSFKVRTRRRLRQQLHKDRQAEARSAIARQQAHQQAAEIIARADQLQDDHQITTSLPATAPDTKERRKTDPFPEPVVRASDVIPASQVSANGTDTNQADLNQADFNQAASAKQTAGDDAKTEAGSGSSAHTVRALAALPLLLLLVWPWLAKLFGSLLIVWQLAVIFLRVGTVTFGGGFVMIPQIEADIVGVHRWMNHQTFADGMAFGQITPGPVLITATFIGYKVAGLVGAIVATFAAFLPSFVMTVLAGTSLHRFRSNHQVQAFLAGVAPAVVGMLAAAGVSLARSGLGSPVSYGLATLAFLLMMRARLNPLTIIFGCGVMQWAIARGLIGLPN